MKINKKTVDVNNRTFQWSKVTSPHVDDDRAAIKPRYQQVGS